MERWMRQLYIGVLKFNVPTKQLMPYKRPFHNEWSFLTMQKISVAFKKCPHVQDFIDALQEVDDLNNPDIKILKLGINNGITKPRMY
jgi:hypothetical protein